MQERSLLRFGSVSAIVGGILAVIVNLVHPRTIEVGTPEGLLRMIAESSNTFWLSDHTGIAIAVLLYLGGLTAIYRSITKEPGAAWARLGFVGAVLGSAVGGVFVAHEFAMRGIAGTWAAAAGAEKAIALRIATATLLEDLALFYVFIIVFFGVAHVLYSLAVLSTDVYPQWLGWVALAGGIGSLLVGLVHVFRGTSVLMTNVLFVIFSVLLSLWVTAMGVVLRSKSRA